MQSVNHDKISTLEAELKDRFAEFHQLNPASNRRRYPRELKALVVQAKEKGLRSATICRLSGLSSSAVHRYSAAGGPKVIQPRRLTIVDTKAAQKGKAPVVIRLSSGVSIELSDGSGLSPDLLKSLSALVSAEVL
jgi:hypothetical protein